MSKEHTPTPWVAIWNEYIIPAGHVDRRIGGSTNKAEDMEHFAHVVCRIDRNSNRFSAEHANSNAAFIVKAVNSHERLCTLASALLRSIEWAKDNEDSPKSSLSHFVNLEEECIAVLAEAGAK